MRLYVLYLIWKYPTLTSLTLLLMRKNLTCAWFKVGASKNLSVLSQKAKITQLNGFNVSQRNTVSKQTVSLFWNFTELFRKVLRIFRATFQIQTVQTDFLFWKSFHFKSFKCFRLKKFYRLQEKYAILYHFAYIWTFWVLEPLENFPYHSLLVFQQLIIFFWHQQPIYAFLGYIHFNENSIFRKT